MHRGASRFKELGSVGKAMVFLYGRRVMWLQAAITAAPGCLGSCTLEFRPQHPTAGLINIWEWHPLAFASGRAGIRRVLSSRD